MARPMRSDARSTRPVPVARGSCLGLRPRSVPLSHFLYEWDMGQRAEALRSPARWDETRDTVGQRGTLPRSGSRPRIRQCEIFVALVSTPNLDDNKSSRLICASPSIAISEGYGRARIFCIPFVEDFSVLETLRNRRRIAGSWAFERLVGAVTSVRWRAKTEHSAHKSPSSLPCSAAERNCRPRVSAPPLLSRFAQLGDENRAGRVALIRSRRAHIPRSPAELDQLQIGHFPQTSAKRFEIFGHKPNAHAPNTITLGNAGSQHALSFFRVRVLGQ